MAPYIILSFSRTSDKQKATTIRFGVLETALFSTHITDINQMSQFTDGHNFFRGFWTGILLSLVFWSLFIFIIAL